MNIKSQTNKRPTLSKRPSLSILRHLGKVSADGYIVYDFREHEVLYANSSIGNIRQIAESRPYTLGFLAAYLNEDMGFIRSCITRLLEEGALENVELRLRGEDRFIMVSANLLRGDELVVVVIKDISGPKKLLNYITEFGARKDATLDMVAHNLSGPLNLTDNLLSAIDRLPSNPNTKAIHNYTRIIRENTQRCLETINSLLVVEHLASETVVVKSSRFDVITHIRLIIDCMRPFHQDKKFVLNSVSGEVVVSFDDVKLFQIVHNLLSNAFKFTPHDGRITVDVTDSEELISVSVRDTGIGIPDFLQSRLFERDTPAARAGLKGERSIGMGLYIVRKLVLLMNGEIDFTSEENKGATFTVSLPKAILRNEFISHKSG